MPQRTARLEHLVTLAALTCACLVLAACGAGAAQPFDVVGGGTDVDAPAAPGGPVITTMTLPPASAGEAYGPVALEATNVHGLPTWGVEAGELPPGLAMSANGVLSGAPASKGYYPITVRVEDARSSDTRDLGIAVDTVGLFVTSGLMAGDAWTHRPITLTATGQAGSVTFSVVGNGSGGHFSNEDGATGTATWTPGPTGGDEVFDTLRVDDPGGTAGFELTVPVMPDPTDTHTAAFGSTDVWWLDCNQKFGTHGYATDLHAALAQVGLRAPQSSDAEGTLADETALLLFRIELLRQINVMFRRNSDGTAGADGMPVSFPFEEPGSGYAKPAAAGWLAGGSMRYSQMSVVHGTTPGVVGTAFVDTTANDFHENDTTSGTFELGVFSNQLTSVFNVTYANPLAQDPIGANDVAALRALVYGLPDPGGRYADIEKIGRGFARSVAAVAAHEIGHSLGLEHTSPSTPGSIMNPSATISPSATYTFVADAAAQLGSALPGTGRGGSSSKPTSGAPSTAVPGGGVRVCNCRHHLAR